jgi:hypothetical protein
MPAKRGRLEAIFSVPSGVTIMFDDAVIAPVIKTITAGDYTITSLVAFLNANKPSASWTFSFSGGESGTGKITMTCTDGPISVTWSSSTLRDIMGYAADIVAQASPQTGTKQCRTLWLPDTEKWTPHGDDDGNGNAAVKVAALRQMMSPTGAVKSIASTSYREFRGIRWEGVSRARTKLIGEGVTNESFERFWRDIQLGELAYCIPGSKIRFYWDADVATYTEVRLVGLREFDPRRMRDNWVGKYIVELPRLVLV